MMRPTDHDERRQIFTVNNINDDMVATRYAVDTTRGVAWFGSLPSDSRRPCSVFTARTGSRGSVRVRLVCAYSS